MADAIPALSVEHLTKRFGERVAFDDYLRLIVFENPECFADLYEVADPRGVRSLARIGQSCMG